MPANHSVANPAQLLLGNQWAAQLEAERDRADQAESALHATQVEAADIMLRATESAQVLLTFAQDAAQQLVRAAQEQAVGVLALASETAEQLLREAEGDGNLKSSDAVHEPYSEGAQHAERVLEESQAAALTELRLQQAVAAEALEAARAKASEILEVG